MRQRLEKRIFTSVSEVLTELIESEKVKIMHSFHEQYDEAVARDSHYGMRALLKLQKQFHTRFEGE